jgi:hypothetical protein
MQEIQDLIIAEAKSGLYFLLILALPLGKSRPIPRHYKGLLPLHLHRSAIRIPAVTTPGINDKSFMLTIEV